MRLPAEIHGLFAAPRGGGRGLLVNASLLQDRVVRNIPWQYIGRNLRQGLVEAVSVSATHIASGKTTVFVDRDDGECLRGRASGDGAGRAHRSDPCSGVGGDADPFSTDQDQRRLLR
ncbi:MAG: hypothetical protein R3C68_09575 [Myxococcota bacterium]